MNTKQVIVFRKDLLKGDKSIRKGKFAAQCCHASVGALLECFSKKTIKYDDSDDEVRQYETEFGKDGVLYDWLEGSYAKVVVSVESEQELLELEKICLVKSLPHKLIVDEGRTEFNGQPTYTCLGIGPYLSEEIDKITGNLPLL